MMNKHKIAIMVDSACDVPQDLLTQLPIFVVPISIQYQNELYFDRVTIQPEEVYQRLAHEIPTTSLPLGSQVEAVLEEIQKAGYEQIIAFSISSALSGTYQLFKLMLDSCPLPSILIDTKSIGIGSGLFAIEAAYMVEAGKTAAEIQACCARPDKSKVFISLSTLDYLEKGGRLGLVTAKVGQLLKVKPIISCNKEGVYYTAAKVRGTKKRLSTLLTLVDEVLAQHPERSFVLAVAAGADEQGRELYEQLKTRHSNAQHLYYGDISPALVVHTGPGLLGVAVYFLH